MANNLFTPQSFASQGSLSSSDVLAACRQTDLRLGGTGSTTLSAGPTGFLGNTGEPARLQDPMSGEVDSLILAQFEELRKALKSNREAAEEFATVSSAADEQCDIMHELIAKVQREINAQRRRIKAEGEKANALDDLSGQCNRMAASLFKEQDAKSQYARPQSINYLNQVAFQQEKSFADCEDMLGRIERLLSELRDVPGTEGMQGRTFRDELSRHMRRFDDIFTAVANQVYSLGDATEKLKEVYLKCQKDLYGRYAADPFEKLQQQQKSRKVEDRYASLKGLDAFPSQTALLSISEYWAPKQGMASVQFTPTLGSTPAGTSSNLLFGGGGAKNTSFPTISTGNVFGSVTTAVTTPFNKPFATTAATFAAPATTPAFGATPSASTAPTNNLFGSTLSSSTSGTLFTGQSK